MRTAREAVADLKEIMNPYKALPENEVEKEVNEITISEVYETIKMFNKMVAEIKVILDDTDAS
jgi:hypothetical protein